MDKNASLGVNPTPSSVISLEALKAGGLPCTLEQFSQRFTGYVRSAMTGHDARNTRLTIDE